MERISISLLTIIMLLDTNVISTAFCIKTTNTIAIRATQGKIITTTSSCFNHNNDKTDNEIFTAPFSCPCSYPNKIEDWDSDHVESWLRSLGYEQYISGFAADFSGIGVDGNRLVYLGTPDQLDHIEYQLDLLGVDDEDDQVALGNAIIALVGDDQLVEDLSRESLGRAYDRHAFVREGEDDTNYQI